MKRILGTAAAMVAAATTAQAGGVEKSTQSVAILFETGSYAELSFGHFSPDVSGVTGSTVGPFTAGRSSGDMAAGYNTVSLGYKTDLSENLALAIILDEPIGAKVRYPGTIGFSSYPLAGTTADLTSSALTALLKYKFENNVSVYGGLRYQTVKGVVDIPFVGFPGPGYTLTTNYDSELGYVVGLAWEKPEIAARVALTYNSAITHTLDSFETLNATSLSSTFDTEVPQSVNLEFQTGVAKDTLLFGSIRWVDWSEFVISPPLYSSPLAVNDALVEYAKDRVTYNLGIGRRFNEQWSGAVTVGYEASDGERTGNLGPTDGATSIGLAGTYTMDAVKITAGIRYVDIGDATTNPPLNARFTGNDGIGVGFRIGYSF
jgi:long-subunit fatty acid transport protein